MSRWRSRKGINQGPEQNQVLHPSGKEAEGEEKEEKIGQREERGRSRYEERCGKTLIILRQTHRGCAHRYMRDVECDAVREKERKYDGIILTKRTRTRGKERGESEDEHRARAREFSKNGAALTFMKMKL